MKNKFLFICSLVVLTFSTNTFFAQSTANADMIKVDGGTFWMGADEYERGSDNDEDFQHQVKVGTFLLSKYEVTVYQWTEYAKATGSRMPDKPLWGFKDSYPVNKITWQQAISFCNWLSKKDGYQPVYSMSGPRYVCNFKANGYRLPTEAEWEYAAKGGRLSSEKKFSGSDKADKVAWHKLNSNGTPHTVGTKVANELGIYDMSGNLWEWCWDWYGTDYYKRAISNNPKGPEMGDKRVVRGGSWDSKLEYLRPANRISTFPDKTHEFYGFRLARTITTK
ncbi:MAG: SUMF1/EgtB/PvdO family nonheme iron enzyme [Bacteroidota bacterium]